MDTTTTRDELSNLNTSARDLGRRTVYFIFAKKQIELQWPTKGGGGKTRRASVRLRAPETRGGKQIERPGGGMVASKMRKKDLKVRQQRERVLEAGNGSISQ